MPPSAFQFQTIRSEGAILPPDLLLKVAAGGKAEIPGLTPESYHLPPGVKLKEAISQSWTRLQAHWREFKKIRANLGDHDDTGTVVTREKWLLPLLNEIGYGRLPTTKGPEIDGKSYAIDRFYNHLAIHLIGCKLPLDTRTRGARGAATAKPHSLVQEFLNRSEPHVWGFLSNGLQFRILRDSKALSRQSFLEFDLEAMFDGEVYADFAILWMVCHQSRVESERAAECWLEQWSKLSYVQGTRVLLSLRVGVRAAIEALGRGFVGHPRNEFLRERLRSGDLSAQNLYRQLLRVVYRLLFLFVAEDRGLLHPPEAASGPCDVYDRFYSTRRLRELSERMRGSKHGDLWYSMSFVFDKLNRDAGCPELGLPGLGSLLWSPEAIPDLLGPPPRGVTITHGQQSVHLANDDLLTAIRALAFTEENRVRRAVDYRNLGSEELGSVYESLLELHPRLDKGATSDAPTFELHTAAGNERKTSGSYYTPDSLVQCLLDSALEPVVADALQRARSGSDGALLKGDSLRSAQEQALLDLKTCDPACGSGHFLIAAAHRLAAHLARVRSGESEPAPDDYRRSLRDVIRRCIYGVDLNPMAVELCKVSLWMESLEPGRPLSFLDGHIKVGNSLLGTTPALLAQGIPDAAFEPLTGDDKKVVAYYKKRNKQERKARETGGQKLLGEEYREAIEARLGNMPATLAAIAGEAEDDLGAVRRHEERYAAAVRDTAYENARLVADAWCAAFVWRKHETDTPGALVGFAGNWDAITEQVFRRIERDPLSLQPWMRNEIKRLTDEYRFFHWHIEFPEVFGWHDAPPVNGHLRERVGVQS
jgi:hypothetical protein